MLLFRSLALGLLGACFVLLAMRPSYEVRIEKEIVGTPALPRPSATIIDVAPDVSPTQLAALVHLAPGEHVTAVDDEPVAGNLDAGALIAQRSPPYRGYLDLSVAGSAGTRRVLVLLH